MAFKYQSKKSGSEYYLHFKKVTLRGGKEQTIYFFAKSIGGKSGSQKTLDEVPAGYVVAESERTGLPFLKKK